MSEIIKGKCEATLQLKKLVEMVAKSHSTVLLRGETGCGKDVVARAIHESSKRNGELINVNCAAIPSELLESELFGHEKGAFTGADSKREGRFEASNNGTLLLDEISEINADVVAAGPAPSPCIMFCPTGFPSIITAFKTPSILATFELFLINVG